MDESKPSILLVEDTLTQALLIQHQLKKAGYTVKLARSGQAALDELSKEKYEIVLSDINMPGMDGYELCQRLRQSEVHQEIPFVLLATPVEKIELSKMLQSGADNFILKAFDENTFIDKLDEIIKTLKLRAEGKSNIIVHAGQTFSFESNYNKLADFLASSFDMYIFQLNKSSQTSTSHEQ